MHHRCFAQLALSSNWISPFSFCSEVTCLFLRETYSIGKLQWANEHARYSMREKQRERERQRDRDRQTNRKTDKQKDRQTDIQTDRMKERESLLCTPLTFAAHCGIPSSKLGYIDNERNNQVH